MITQNFRAQLEGEEGEEKRTQKEFLSLDSVFLQVLAPKVLNGSSGSGPRVIKMLSRVMPAMKSNQLGPRRRHTSESRNHLVLSEYSNPNARVDRIENRIVTPKAVRVMLYSIQVKCTSGRTPRFAGLVRF